jgi:hypothetical protein
MPSSRAPSFTPAPLNRPKRALFSLLRMGAGRRGTKDHQPPHVLNPVPTNCTPDLAVFPTNVRSISQSSVELSQNDLSSGASRTHSQPEDPEGQSRVTRDGLDDRPCTQNSRSRRLRVTTLLASVATMAMAIVATTPALALNPERHYELVSPIYKGGYGVALNGILAVAPDGERVAFDSNGAFAGDPANQVLENFYLASRVDRVGWSTAPLTPPASIVASGAIADFSPALDTTLSEVSVGPNFGAANTVQTEREFLVHPSDAPDTAPNAPVPGPNFEVAGMTLKDLGGTDFRASWVGASSTFSHLVLEDPGVIHSEQLLPGAATGNRQLYDLARSSPCGALSPSVCSEPPASGGVGGESSLRLLALNNSAQGKQVNPSCTPQIGNAGGALFNSVSADGSEVFFSVGPDSSKGCAPQLFVRLGGQRTLEVSRPLDASLAFGGCVGKGVPGEVPCQGAAERGSARFSGASEDGSKAFFTSTQPLVPGDGDVSNNLYMVTIGCPGAAVGCEPAERVLTGLVRVSSDPNGVEPAAVQDVVAVAPDGSHVYFVAGGDLLSPAERGVLAGEGRVLPRTGADNLYVYDSVTGRTGFIAGLCSGPGLSGGVSDIRCPSSLGKEVVSGSGNAAKNDRPLWEATSREVQVNVCSRPGAGECVGARETGRFLVFSTYAQLTPDDTDAGKDVYRYDTVTGALERVSGGEEGYDANGNGVKSDGSAFDATLASSDPLFSPALYVQRELVHRAVTEDGSRIVFTSAEPLSPVAGNGIVNAYEWDEGGVSLVSGGSATRDVQDVVISSSGRDVFFTTTQGLVPQDTDGQEDLYDARLEGGFPSPPGEREACAGDACQGPLTNPAPLLVPGSVAQPAGENLPPPRQAAHKKKPKRAKKTGRARRAGRAHGHGRSAKGRGR